MVLAAPVAAQSTEPTCGDVLTQSVTLTAPLTGCSTGLVIGADGITVDLNGYSIEGIGADGSVGVEAVGHADVAVRNGSIRGFSTAVAFFSTVRSSASSLRIQGATIGISLGHALLLPPLDANEVSSNVIEGGEIGIRAFGQGDRITGNAVETATSSGLFLRGAITLTNRTLVADNRFTRNEVGIFQFNSEADLLGNTVTESAGDGIVQLDSVSTVVGNTVTDSGGHGITGADAHALYRRNVTNANGGDGLRFSDSFPDHGPFFEVTGHVANTNGGYGIFTDLTGVVDGGKNRAHANGNAVQCVGVVCNAQGFSAARRSTRSR